MNETSISEALASALQALVEASDAADKAPTDRQVARRAIEQARLVVDLARREGFGSDG